MTDLTVLEFDEVMKKSKGKMLSRMFLMRANPPLLNTKLNCTVVYAMHTAKQNVPHLLPFACHCHIVSGLSAYSLISICQLCNARWDVLFSTNAVSIGFRNTIIIQGAWSYDTGLWHIDLTHHDGLQTVLLVSLTLLLSTGKSVYEVPSSIPCYCFGLIQHHTTS